MSVTKYPVLTFEDGANALGLSHEQLVAEAQSWAVSKNII